MSSRWGFALLIVALGACAKADNSADTARAGATTAAAPMAGDTTHAATPAALNDANIVYILDQANAADSARGTLAQQKATNARVKRFGVLMAGEHHALRLQGQALAKKLNVTPQQPSGDQSEQQAKQELDSLNAAAKGAAWDKTYIDYEVNYHQQVLETATKALGAAQNAELKALIQKAAPVIQHHLDMAKQIQSQVTH
jgi:putative membrane protein